MTSMTEVGDRFRVARASIVAGIKDEPTGSGMAGILAIREAKSMTRVHDMMPETLDDERGSVYSCWYVVSGRKA